MINKNNPFNLGFLGITHSLRYLLLLFFCVYSQALHADILDNRYFPLFLSQIERSTCERSGFTMRLFALDSSQARACDGDSSTSLLELGGKYDLIKIGKALSFVGKPNPLPTEWQSASSLVWRIRGHLSGIGAAFTFEKSFLDHWALGCTWAFMRVSTSQRFRMTDEIARELRIDTLNTTRAEELQRTRRQASVLLGIEDREWTETGPGDIDVYIRFGTIKNYQWHCRKVDAGVQFGAIVPTGLKRNIDNALSVPFGGNGLWGLYGRADINIELKEDLLVGAWLQAGTRLSRICQRRMPAAGESLAFGAIVGPVRIDPGFTAGFSPYVRLNDVHDGFGVEGRYTVIVHEDDAFTDMRACKVPPISMKTIKEFDEWVHEYASLSLRYDFAKTIRYHNYTPTAFFSFDMPINLFASHSVSKTARISLGFECHF
jgi:hypothetical protein